LGLIIFDYEKLIISLIMGLISINSFGFEIFALGTSNTNCKNADQAFTVKLNELLALDKIDAQAVNAGVDGDRPVFMMPRLEQGLKNYPNTKMVIFEPGPNERNPKFNLGPSEEILAYLQKIQMPTIYVSHKLIQSPEEAGEMAKNMGLITMAIGFREFQLIVITDSLIWVQVEGI